MGMKADANAPPATRLKSVSATRLAALNASISAFVPKAFAIRICLIKPAMLLIMNATITVPAALAICRLTERLDSFID
jgi:hypothetical protein